MISQDTESGTNNTNMMPSIVQRSYFLCDVPSTQMTFMKLSDVDVSWSSVSFCVTKQCPVWSHACCCRTMDWLMRHLYRMSLQSERTGMTSKNLAIVWSPNILRCDVSELDTQDALQVLHPTLNITTSLSPDK